MQTTSLEQPLVRIARKSYRIEELKAQGRYGYQLRMPRKALRLAVQEARTAGETEYMIGWAIQAGQETFKNQKEN